MRERSAKRLAAAASALLLTATLAACQKGADTPVVSSSGSASSDAGGKTTVTVAVFTEDRFLKEAVDRFEESHPNIDIQIQETVPTDTSSTKMVMKQGSGAGPGADGPAAEDVDKYVNAVGTALMSGHAADLISVAHLPIDRYLDKGMFADWNELAGASTDFQPTDYYERVLKGMSDGKTWYAIPIDYSVEALIGNKSALDRAGGADDRTWTWEQFIALCEQIAAGTGADGTKQQALGGTEPTDVIGYLTQSLYDKLIAKKGKSYSFDEEAFRGYLEQVKQLYDSGAASADDIGRLQQAFLKMSLATPMDLAMLPNALGDGQGEVLRPPGSGQDDGMPFSSDLALALNAKSKVKPAAWEFVKFLLSEDIQSSPSMMGFPVHQAAVKTRLEQFAEQLNSGKTKMMVRSKDGETKSMSVTDEQIESALKLLPSVGKYTRTDDKVIDIVKEETGAYFTGSKTAEAVARAVADRVDTYLNE